MSVFVEICPVWVQVERMVDGDFEKAHLDTQLNLPLCDVSRQLNVLNQAASCSSRYDIRDIAIHNIRLTETRDCAYLMSPKKGETGRGLSKNFQQPYEQCNTYKTMRYFEPPISSRADFWNWDVCIRPN
ncbi:hypothetical protein CSKR_100986 [Clonorchis sinensis]|uniref:Uncharacterized protein n=1 Tax=Clonorchis sinensis TaxID=79923 RepID=A0A3R7DHE6_CLOSI|nr:hypothetical protein CSKR_100986 [Clonorchis sinensis]